MKKMKKMKKIFAFMLALAMMLSLTGIVNAGKASAAGTTGSISVSSNHKGQVYTLYKLFDAHITFADDGKTVRAITYSLPTGKTEADLTYNGKSWFKLNANKFIEVNDSSVTTEWAKDPDAIAWAKSFGTKVQTEITAASENDENVKWDNVDYGYYYVDSTLGSFIGVDSNTPNITIKDKNNPPKINKEITGVTTEGGTKSGVTLGMGDDVTDPGNGVNEKAIAQIGDTVSYKLTVYAKPGAENYQVTDTLTNLKLKADTLKIDGTSYADVDIVDKDNSSVEDKASTFTIKFTKTYLDTITTDKNITIEYDAVITGTAVTIGEDGNENTAELTWGHKTDKDSSTDKAKVYTGKISVVKKDNSDAGLEGATFALKNGDKYYKVDTATGNVTWIDNKDDATQYTSQADGKLNGEFTGLANGSYTLEETKTPEGFNPIDPNDASLKFTIENKGYTNDNLIQKATVINKQGSTLPSTGGIGTTIFYVLGGILMAAAVVLLITKKKMSAYRD